MNSIKIKCPAKINLSLDVVGKRQDGYHLVSMLMQSISLFDDVSVEKGNAGIRIYCEKSNVPCNESNTAFKTAKLVIDKFGIKDGVNIYIRRRNPYITIETCDIGKFVYLVPVASIYDEDYIKVVRSDSEKVTCDAFREKNTDTTFVSIFSGKYFRYDGNTYYTEAFSSFSWSYMYDDKAGAWLSADGNQNYKEVLKENRDRIPVIKASEGMELCFAPDLTATSVEYFLLSIDLETEQKIGSFSELPGLPRGAYYLICKVRTEGRAIAGDTEKSEYFCIFLLDV
jgi:hypothetical protein